MRPTTTTVSFIRIVFLIVSMISVAQVVNDTLPAWHYYQKADSLLTARKYDSSVTHFKKALPIYQKANAWERVASCYNKISEGQLDSRKLEKSLQSAKIALKICKDYLDKDHKEKANTFDNIGRYYQRLPKYKEALFYYEEALKLRQNKFSEYHPDIATSYTNLAILHVNLSEYYKAIEYYNKALSINSEVYGVNYQKNGKIYNGIGVSYRELGKSNKALDYYKKSLEITINKYGEHHLYAAYSYTNIGVLHYSLMRYDKASEFYQKALQIFIEKNFLTGIADIYQNIGIILLHKGEIDRALEYYKKGLNKNIEIYGNDHPKIGIIYNNIGVVFSEKEDHENALNYYNKNLQICKKVYGEYHQNTGVMYHSIGNVHRRKKDYSLALDFYKKSLAVYASVFDENHPDIAGIYGSLAILYLEKKNYNDALFYSQKNLNLLQNFYGKQNPLSTQTLNQIADIYSKQKDYDKAIYHYNKALKVNIKNKDDKNFENTLDSNKHYDLKLLIETLQGKAQTLQSKYVESNKVSNLQQSIKIYEHADILINYIRKSFKNYQDKITFAKSAKEIYRGAIEAQLLLHQSQKDQTSLEQAWYYAEKSKANTLKELLNHAKAFSGLPETLVSLEKDLRTEASFYQSQLAKEQSGAQPDSLKITEHENNLFEISRRQDSLTAVLENNYPKYHQLKYQNQTVSVAEIQNKLDAQTSLLEFFTADSVTYAFTITKNQLEVQELATPNLADRVEEFRHHITTKDLATYKTSAHALYNTLIAPVKEQLQGDRLIIIPDGPLWHLNFELLLTQKGASNNPKDLPYLLKDHAISYANSANLLFAGDKSTIPSQPQECLAFSFSDSTQTTETNIMRLATLRDTSDDLPGTRKEIKAIADIIDGQYFFGSQAIEANFKKHANHYGILHLALHGEVDNEHPENSKLFFTKNKDTLEDNLLYSHELFALDIPAALTVLSACNTGSGKIAKGEGIMSLGNAFQYAGTQSLLLTGWEVSDQTTPELMKYFYTNLKEGMNKAKALQQAKLQYLQTAQINRTHPFYWGGFYLVGETAPINFENDTIWYWVLGLVILSVIILIVFWYRRSVKN